MTEDVYIDPIKNPLKMRLNSEDVEIISRWGRNVDVMPTLLKEHRAGKARILSELDIRRLAIQNPDAYDFINNYWDTSTLSARKRINNYSNEMGKPKDIMKIILPYCGNNKMTDSAIYALGLINPKENLLNSGVRLEPERWEKLQGAEVYSGDLSKWFERRADGSWIGYNEEMTKEQALKNAFLLTRLQHPDYVEPEFAISADEVSEIIERTFDMGRQEHGYTRMMGQYLDDPDMPAPQGFSEIGILKPMCVRSLTEKSAGMKLYGELDIADGRFASLSEEG